MRYDYLRCYSFNLHEKKRAFFLTAIQGVAALFAVNVAGGLTGVTLSVNALTIGSGVLFGTPGIIMNLIAEVVMTR